MSAYYEMNDIDKKERSPILVFKMYLYKYMKNKNLPYSQKLENTLRVLHQQSKPITVESLTDVLNNGKIIPVYNYDTTLTYIEYLRESGLIKLVDETNFKYLLHEEAIPKYG